MSSKILALQASFKQEGAAFKDAQQGILGLCYSSCAVVRLGPI